MIKKIGKGRKIVILDPTIREVGCLIDWSFSLDQAEEISKRLEQAGVEWVEMGHVLGLGIAELRYSQEEYIEAMASVLDESKVSTFALTGVCAPEDVNSARKAGLEMIRIGFIGFRGGHSLKNAIPLVKHSKSKGLKVTLNILLSHRINEGKLRRILKETEDLTLDAYYVVDSAGAMLPSDVKSQVEYIVNNTNTPVGFHGHQQFGMAVANSIEAVNAGGSFVDGTLLGAGRKPGNAQVEVITAVLKKLGYKTGVNWRKLSKVGEEALQPILADKTGVKEDELEFAYYGQVGVTRSLIEKASKEFQINYIDILEELDKRGVHFVSEGEIKKVCKFLKKNEN